MSPLLKKKKGIVDDKYLLRKYCMMSALFSCGIMCIVYFLHDNTLLFGDSTVLRMDLYHQYCPLYAEVYDRLTSGDSIVYSWTSGLGGSFIGNFFNYCSSPFAFIMFLFGHKNIPEAIAVMILLKAVLASVAFTYYVNKSNCTVKKESVLFGLFYAFSAYFVAYSWNIMWLDAFAVFPLVILGIERIIQYNKPLTYIVAMTYTMITNYYMAYMVCILSVMYFLYFYFGRYELSSKIYRPVVVEDVIETVEQAVSVEDNEKITENTVEKVSIEDFAEFNEVKEDDVEIVEKEENSDIFCTVTDTEFSEKLESENIPSLQTEPSVSKDKKKEKHHKFKDNRFWITGWTFAFSSFLCFMFAAFALMPIVYCLQSSSATAGTFPEESKQYFDIFTFLANHLPGIETTIRSSGDNVIPNVYCGLITVMLLPLYFLSQRIPGKQKVVSAILLMACLCGFVLNYFNYIWHGFHMPNDLPYRWSFAYSFFLLIIAYKAFSVLDEFSNKAYIGLGFSVMCFVVLVEKFEIPNVDELTIVLSVVFALLYVIIFGMLKSPKYRRNAVVSLLFFAVILEILAADGPKFVMQQSKEAYTSDYYNYQEISESVEADETEAFYRTELTKLRARMDPSWYGYNGVSTFTSMAYESTAKLVRKLGLFGNNINSYTYYPQTPVFNSMFNIKYLYDNKNFIETNDKGDNVTEADSSATDMSVTESTVNSTQNEVLTENTDISTITEEKTNAEKLEAINGDNYLDFYTFKTSNEKFEAFEYNYFLPLIFSVDSNVTDWDYSSSNPFEVQNNLVDAATDIKDVFIGVDATDVSVDGMNNVNLSNVNSGNTFSVSKSSTNKTGEVTVKLQPEKAGNYYIFTGGNNLKSLKITVDGLEYTYVTSSISSFILDVGYLEGDEEIVVTYTVAEDKKSSTLTFKAAILDAEKFENAYSIIKSNGTVNLTSFDETDMSGTINVTNDNALLWTSIPYDEGWEIYVDGELMTYTQVDEETEEVKKVGDIVNIGGGLIGIKVEAGEHEIKLHYSPSGLSTGITFTVIGIAIAAVLIIYKKWLYEILKKIGFVPVFMRKPDYFNN